MRVRVASACTAWALAAAVLVAATTPTAATPPQPAEASTTNQAPVVANPIADMPRAISGVANTVQLEAAGAPVFSDADADTLTYSASVGDPAKATASVTGAVLTVTGATHGTTAVTVTATDPSGDTAQTAFAVTVFVDYDSDDDKLIEVSNLYQLEAIDWDRDADGRPDTARASDYYAVFPGALVRMGCPEYQCKGYELVADLDFDSDNDNDVDADDHDGHFWNNGNGWTGIAAADQGWKGFKGTLEGNGHTIYNLYMQRDDHTVRSPQHPANHGHGLFGTLGRGGVIRNLGLVNVDITAGSPYNDSIYPGLPPDSSWPPGRQYQVGAFAGNNRGLIQGVYVTGRITVTGDNDSVGGIVGEQWPAGELRDSYTNMEITTTSTGEDSNLGGLVGFLHLSRIYNSYAAGSITGPADGVFGGGLIGNIWPVRSSRAQIVNSFSVADVSASAATATNGGLLALNRWHQTINVNSESSYWDTNSSGQSTSVAGTGLSTVEMQAATNTGVARAGYDGVYSNYSRSLWDFGTSNQYPALSVDFNGDGTATWQEFGDQRPNRAPVVTATIDDLEAQIGATAVLDMTDPDGAHFADPEGGALSFTASSSDSAVAATQVDGASVLVSAVQAGNADVTVTASDASGNSTSHTFTVTVVAATGHAPSRPTMQITPGDGHVRLDFEPGNPGEVVTNWKLRYGIGGNRWCGGFLLPDSEGNIGGTIRSYTVTGKPGLGDVGGNCTSSLRSGEPYYFELHARNDHGYGTTRFVAAMPGEATTLTVSPGDGSASLQWTPLSYTGFHNWQYRQNGGDWTDIPAQANSTNSFEVNNLANNVAHDFEVRAVRWHSNRNKLAHGAGSNTVTVVPVPAPVVATALAAQSVGVGQSISIDLEAPGAPVFTDPDGRSLAYVAVAPANSAVSASVTGTTLTITGLASGTATVDVDAVNSALILARTTVSVTVLPGSVPVLNPMADIAAISTGSVVELPLGGDATVSQSVTSSDSSVVAAYVDGSILRLSAAATGTARISLRVTNSDGLWAYDTFFVTVDDDRDMADTSTTIGELADVDLAVEDGPLARIADLGDPDQTVTYSPSAADTSVATTSVDGSTLTVGGLAAGSTVITATASTATGLSVSHGFTVTVSAPATAPGEPTLWVTGGDGQIVTNWTPGAGGSATKWQLRYGPNGASLCGWFDVPDANADINGVVRSYTITGPPGLGPVGGNCPATLADDELQFVELRAVNDHGTEAAPLGAVFVGDLPVLSATTDDAQTQLTWTHPNYSKGTSWQYRHNGGDWTTITGSNADTRSHTVAGLANDTEYAFEVRASAVGGPNNHVGHGGASAPVTVTPTAAPVVARAIPAHAVGLDAAVTIPLATDGAEVFDDADLAAVTYSATSSDTAVVAVAVAGNSTDAPALSLTGVTAGDATISLTATDKHGVATTTTFSVTVAAGAAPVVARPIYDIWAAATGSTLNIGLETPGGEVFSDADGHSLTYSASSNDSMVVAASVSGTTLQIEAVTPGTTSITVGALDSSGLWVSTTFEVSVGVDYDTDRDGLIGVANLAQLAAIGGDPDGDGIPEADRATAYAAAFGGAAGGVVCAQHQCSGYELVADLDFDSDNDGDVDADDHNGAFWNSGKGWSAISGPFEATFDGNGHTIANLYVRDDRSDSGSGASGGSYGLFAHLGQGATVRNVGLTGVDIVVGSPSGRGSDVAGSLAARSEGTITAAYATGSVSARGDRDQAGGLVAVNLGNISRTYASVDIYSRRERATGGGLVASNDFSTGDNLSGVISDSYATGSVRWGGGGDFGQVANFVGMQNDLRPGSSREKRRKIINSFAVGAISGTRNGGNFIWQGDISYYGSIVNGYWDMQTSGRDFSWLGHGTPFTTVELQQDTNAIVAAPAYAGIYEDWDAAIWDYGTPYEYPALSVDFNGDGTATWQEFGDQRPNRAPFVSEVPADLTVTVGRSGDVDLEAAAAEAFVDPDGNALTYSVAVADDTITEASVSGAVITVTPLAVGSTTVTVTATDPGGLSASTAFSVAAVLPDLPGTPSLSVEPGDGVAHLSFAPASEDDLVIKWQARYGLAGGEWCDWFDVVDSEGNTDGAMRSYTVTGPPGLGEVEGNCTATLANGSHYFFEVSAVNAAGSTWSGLAAAMPSTAAVLTGKSGHLEAQLEWTSPAWDAATKWQLRTDGGAWADIPGSDGATRSHTVTGLNTSVTYSFEVRAVSSDNSPIHTAAGVASAPASITVSRAPVVDNTMAFVDITVGGSKSVSAEAVFSDPDGDSLTYQATASDSAVATASVQGSTVTISAATVGSTTVTVVATDPHGATASTDFDVRVNAAGVPLVVNPVSSPTLPAGVGMSLSLNGAMPVFSDPGGLALTYTAAGSDAAVATVTLTGTALQVDALAAGTATVTLTATNTDGTANSYSFTVAVSGAAVGDLPGVIQGDDLATLTWPAPGHSSVTGFQYRMKTGDAAFGPWTDVPNSGPSSTFHVITGLTNGEQYTFGLRAVTTRGLISYPNEPTVTPRPNIGDALLVYFSDDGTNTTIEFTGRLSTRGLIRTSLARSGYNMMKLAPWIGEIRVWGRAGTEWSECQRYRLPAGVTVTQNIVRSVTQGNSTNPTAISGHGCVIARDDNSRSGAAYHLVLGPAYGPLVLAGRVRDVAGDSDFHVEYTYTAAGSFRGGKIVFTTTPYSVGAPPKALTGLTATAGDGQVSLAWNDPDDSSIVRYEYRVKTDAGDFGAWQTIAASNANTTAFVATGLANGATHTIEVRSVNKVAYASASSGAVRLGTAPTLANPIGDQSINTGVDVVFDLEAAGSALFFDADSDTLTYTISSGDTAVATVALVGSVLTLSGVAPGSTSVAVTADDGAGRTGHPQLRRDRERSDSGGQRAGGPQRRHWRHHRGVS